MTYDAANIQLVFNVIAITGVTSLAVMCGMLRRDNEKLTKELQERSGQALKAPARRQATNVTPKAPASEDIRKYVSQRLDRWMEIQQAGAKA